MPQYAMVLDAIGEGSMDDMLEELGDAVRERKRYLRAMLAHRNKLEMTPGTRVMIARDISPAYLIGQFGTVAKLPARRHGDVEVDMDHRVGKWARRGGPLSLGVPAASLEVVGG